MMKLEYLYLGLLASILHGIRSIFDYGLIGIAFSITTTFGWAYAIYYYMKLKDKI